MVKQLPKPEKTNPRGIPEAPFIKDLTEYATNLDEATQFLGQVQEMLQKYKFMEVATKTRQKNLKENLPNLQKTFESIQFLKQQSETFDLQYALDDTVFAKAEIQPTEKVWLWLGANVMLEFTLDEAEKMMSEKLEGATAGLKACEEDLEFLRENITTMEVNTARAINYQVSKRSETKAK